MPRLNPSRFNQVIRTLGQRVLWSKAYRCPCRSTSSGQPRAGCPVCTGKGVIWDNPIAAITGVAGMQVQRQWAAFAQWESGDVVLSVPSDSRLYEAGEFDRVRMIQSSEPFSSILFHDVLDRLPFTIVDIDRVFWLQPPANSTIVNGTIPRIAADGTLEWLGVSDIAPPAAVQYNVTGRKRPEYYVFGSFPQDRAHSMGQRLPRRIVARKFDLFGI